MSEFYHSTADCQETEKWSALFFAADYQLHIQTHNHLLLPGRQKKNDQINLTKTVAKKRW